MKNLKNFEYYSMNEQLEHEMSDHVPVKGYYLSNTREEKTNYLKNLFNSRDVNRVSDIIINNVYQTIVDSLSDPDKFRDRSKYLKKSSR